MGLLAAAGPADPGDLGNAKLELLIGFDNRKIPGVGGKLRFVAAPWNGWNR